MKSLAFSALLFAASAWAVDETSGVDEWVNEGQEATAEALEHLAEARQAFEDALAQVETIKFRQVFDNGAMLGVVIRDQEDAGVLVVGVTPESGAEAAGILADDLIVAVNDWDLAGAEHPARLLRKSMSEVEPGDSVRVVLIRDGEERDLHVETMRRPHFAGPFHWRGGNGDFSIFPSADKRVRIFRDRAAARGRGGLELKDIGEDLGEYFGVDAGVLVLDVPPGSALKPGDILRRINDADIGNAREVYRLLAGLDGIGEATVRRANRTRTVEVTPIKGRFGHPQAIIMDQGNSAHADGEVEVEFEVEAE